MRLIRLFAAATCACALSLVAHAQPAPATDDSLYRQLGGQNGLVTLMDDFMVRLVGDPRMNAFFKGVDQKHVKAQLVAQFCEVSGGPCKLEGPDMKKAHSGFDINRGDFNRLVEVLQQSMDAQNIGYATQNRLLAKLAPMHREIINAP